MRGSAIFVVLLINLCAPNDLRDGSAEGTSRTSDRSSASRAGATTGVLRDRGTEASVAAADRRVRPMGTTAATLGSPPCPGEMVLIGRYCIDRYEAHLRSITPDGIGDFHPHNERLASGASYVAVSDKGVFPQGYISRVEAQAACLKASKRLCSRGEWMVACRGTKALPIRGAGARPCNNGKAPLMLQLFGGGHDYEEHFNSPELNSTPGFLAKTGAYADCESESGAHDMIGNLHEWVSDVVTRPFLTQLKAEATRQYQHVQVGNGVFMGGFYSTRGELGPGCLFTTVAHDANYHDYSTGFRCCRARRRPP